MRPGDRTGPLGEAGHVREGAAPVAQAVELRPRRRVPWLTLVGLLAACLFGGCVVAIFGQLIRGRGDTCARARACCADYAVTLYGPLGSEQRCANANITEEQPEEWCLTIHNHMRETLIRNGRPVPETCQPLSGWWIERVRSAD